MTLQRLPRNELSAYYYAGVGVAACYLNVGIGQLSVIRQTQSSNERLLASLGEVCDIGKQHGRGTQNVIADYAVTLLAGQIGKLIRSEVHQKLPDDSPAMLSLRSRWFRTAMQCTDPNVDRAYALALAYFGHTENGNPEATLARFWQRANQLLRQPRNRNYLARLARHLKAKKTMSGSDVVEFMRC